MVRKNSFTSQHWMIIIIGFVLFYFCNACMTDGMNVIAPALAQERGWDYAYMLSFATLSGCVSVFGQLAFGLLSRILGPRKSISIALLGAAGFFELYGLAWSIPVYIIALCGVVTCSTSYAYIGLGGLLGNWFPEKKGIASGYSSIGMPASTATSVAAFTFLFSRLGFTSVMTGVAILLLCLSVVCYVLLRDTPEERGVFPDGVPSHHDQAQTVVSDPDTQEISLKEMFRIREVWLVGIMIGLFSVVATGVMGQFVIRHQQMEGLGRSGALILLTVCAVTGMIGSPVMGWLENRLGTRRGFQICCGLFVAALLLNFTDIRWLIYISILCFGIVITGIPIYMTSFLVSIFGRKNFKTAYALAFPLSSLIGQTAFLFTALALQLFGEVRYAYLLFAGMLVIAVILGKFVRMDRWN